MLPPPISASHALERVVWADTQTEHCTRLWREVIWRIVLDLEPGWGISKKDVAAARAWFEGMDAEAREDRQTLCALAGIGEGVLLNAYRDNRLREQALNPLGRKRWETRIRNKAARAAVQLADAEAPPQRALKQGAQRDHDRAHKRRRSEEAARARAQSREALGFAR